MKFVLLMTAILFASNSFADIRRSSSVDTRTITGKQAEKLMKTMDGKELLGSSLRTSSSVYKVNRSSDGLKQIICEATSDRLKNTTSYRCSIETSTDGEKVPVFHPAIRMG